MASALPAFDFPPRRRPCSGNCRTGLVVSAVVAWLSFSSVAGLSFSDTLWNQTSHESVTFSGSLSLIRKAKLRIERVFPFALVHIPKTGASLENAIVHTKGVCPGIAMDEWVCSEHNPTCETSAEETGVISFLLGPRDTMHRCPGIVRWSFHRGFRHDYDSVGMKEHAVIMMRQPEQRLVSAYYQEGPEDANGMRHLDHHGYQGAKTVLEYAKAMQGLAVRMLTRSDDLEWMTPWKPPMWEEVSKAAQMLKEGFAFVGLTEENPLSICLWHQTFGGQCDPHEFRIWHRGSRHATYNISAELGGWKDPSDGYLYDEASKIFYRNLELFGTSLASCQPCFEQAGYTP